MISTMFDTAIAVPAVAATKEAEFRAEGHSTEIAGLTELVRGHDQDVLDRFMPLVSRQSLTLDLHTVERIDAAGIAVLILLFRSACDAGHRFTVSNASPRVAEILAVVGLDRILLSQNAVHISHSGCDMERSAA